MKKVVSLFALVVSAVNILSAAIPEGYYDSAIGKSGSDLQSELASIISHSDPGYDRLWDIYKTTDVRSDGKVWDMYSNTTDFTFGSDQCGNYSGEGDCYNREHSIPKSWRGGSKYSDVHMVVPTDGYVNNRRSSYPFGEVGSSSYVSDNSFSKVGTCITSGYSGTVFEPNDEYKGDFARIYFYAATRYYSECGSWSGNGFSDSFPYLDEWTRVMMLRWHELDPVSEKEIERNDAVYASRQNNRNPFVDYPHLVDLIFGNKTTTPFSPNDSDDVPYLEYPVSGDKLSMNTVSLAAENPTTTAQLSVKGVNIEDNLTLTLTGSSYFTVSSSTISASSALAGTTVAITYAPRSAGSHTATLTIAGGIGSAVEVILTGQAVEGFAALEATNISDVSFQANWLKHSQATDYELAVWSATSNNDVEQTIFDVSFAQGVPSGWTTGGYTNVESSAVRLGSSSRGGEVITPGIDMSKTTYLTVTCKPYKTTDNSVLYILVDGVEVEQIDCADGEVTATVELAPATTSSSITLQALESSRVYLMSAQLKTGGGVSNDMVEGFPCKVGNVTEYLVEGLQACREYSYKVTAYNGSSIVAESNVITLTIGSSAVDDVKSNHLEGVFLYTYNGAIYIDNAPCNARVSLYSIDGRLCETRMIHTAREVIVPNHRGIYIVQIVTGTTCYAQRVAVN